MVKNKKGISLIVLIVTIIVIIILSSIIVITFSNNNPIGKANEAKFKSDLSGFRDELLATHVDNSIGNSDYVSEKIDVVIVGKISDENENDITNSKHYEDMKKYIPSITEEYSDKLCIVNGELAYSGSFKNGVTNKEEVKWANDIGIGGPREAPNNPDSNLGWGDPSGDGYVTYTDSDIIGKVLSRVITLSDEEKKASDVDGDGDVTVADRTEIEKYTSFIIEKFPVEQ